MKSVSGFRSSSTGYIVNHSTSVNLQKSFDLFQQNKSTDNWKKKYKFGNLGRVVGGTDVTDPKLFPFFGSLRLNSTEAPLCGGTILDKYHFLTAAHCDDRPMITVGSVRTVSTEGIPDTPSGKKAQSLKVRFCKKHPNSKKHKNGVTEYDFKVCKLFAPMHFGESLDRNNS